MRIRLRTKTYVDKNNREEYEKLKSWISKIVERVRRSVMEGEWSDWDLEMRINKGSGISIDASCTATTGNEHRIKLDVVRDSDTIFTVYVDYTYDGSRYGSCCGLCSDVFGIDLTSMECTNEWCYSVKLDTPIGRKWFKVVEYETSTLPEWNVKPDEMIAKWIEDDKIVVGKCKYPDYRKYADCDPEDPVYGDYCIKNRKRVCEKLSLYNPETDPYDSGLELAWKLSEEERRPQAV